MSETKCTLIFFFKNKKKSLLARELFDISCEESSKFIDCLCKDSNSEEVKAWKKKFLEISEKLKVDNSTAKFFKGADDFRFQITSNRIEEKDGFTIITYNNGSDFTIPNYLYILAEAKVNFAALISNYEYCTESFYRVVKDKVFTEFISNEEDLHDQEYYEGIRQWWYSDFNGWNYDKFPYGEMFPDSRPPKSKKGMLKKPPSKYPKLYDELTGLFDNLGIKQVVIEGYGDKFMSKLKKIFKDRRVEVREIAYEKEMLQEVHEDVFQLMILSYKFAVDPEIMSFDIIYEEKESAKKWAKEYDNLEFYDYKVVVVGSKDQIKTDKTIADKADGLITIPPPKAKLSDIENLLKEAIRNLY